MVCNSSCYLSPRPFHRLLEEDITLQAPLCFFQRQSWCHLLVLGTRSVTTFGQLLNSSLLFEESDQILQESHQCVQQESPHFFTLCFHTLLQFTKYSPGVNLCSSTVHYAVTTSIVLTPALERITPEMLPLVLQYRTVSSSMPPTLQYKELE